MWGSWGKIYSPALKAVMHVCVWAAQTTTFYRWCLTNVCENETELHLCRLNFCVFTHISFYNLMWLSFITSSDPNCVFIVSNWVVSYWISIIFYVAPPFTPLSSFSVKVNRHKWPLSSQLVGKRRWFMFWTCGVNQTKLNGMFSLAVTGADRCLKSVTLHQEAKGSSNRSRGCGDDTVRCFTVEDVVSGSATLTKEMNNLLLWKNKQFSFHISVILRAVGEERSSLLFHRLLMAG